MLSQVRFSSIICLGVLLIPCTIYFIRKPNFMAFRAGGALSIDQEKYYMLNLCFSGVTFDLQAQVHSQIPLFFFFSLLQFTKDTL